MTTTTLSDQQMACDLEGHSDSEETEGQLQGRAPTRKGKGDQKRETRQDGQKELRVARSGVPGRAVTCARRNLEKTNIMALGAKGRAGMRDSGTEAGTERVTCSHQYH